MAHTDVDTSHYNVVVAVDRESQCLTGITGHLWAVGSLVGFHAHQMQIPPNMTWPRCQKHPSHVLRPECKGHQLDLLCLAELEWQIGQLMPGTIGAGSGHQGLIMLTKAEQRVKSSPAAAAAADEQSGNVAELKKAQNENSTSARFSAGQSKMSILKANIN